MKVDSISTLVWILIVAFFAIGVAVVLEKPNTRLVDPCLIHESELNPQRNQIRLFNVGPDAELYQHCASQTGIWYSNGTAFKIAIDFPCDFTLSDTEYTLVTKTP